MGRRIVTELHQDELDKRLTSSDTARIKMLRRNVGIEASNVALMEARARIRRDIEAEERDEADRLARLARTIRFITGAS